MTELLLPHAWTVVPWTIEQLAAYHCQSRFVVVPSPRRTGKSELLKRKTVRTAFSVDPNDYPDANYLLGAPTHKQAKHIFWSDVKRLSPREEVARISETDRTVTYWNGATISVAGMDVPERMEGIALDGCGLDEYANMKANVWDEHIYPMLGTPGRIPGWAWLIGVPEGRGHYWKLWLRAMDPAHKSWSGFRWSAEGIVADDVLEAARSEMDSRSYRQEWMGEFVDFLGRAYYDFQTEIHAVEPLTYDASLPLKFCFDFNHEPGVASIIQEQAYRGDNLHVGEQFTAVIGEVYIPRASNTPAVCARLIKDWGHHLNRVVCYGDPSGGSRSSSQTTGTDWDQIQLLLRRHFGDRLLFKVDRGQPTQRARVNATNNRIQNAKKTVRLLVDPKKAPNTVRDFEGTLLLEGGSGEIAKRMTPDLTHLTDAISYYLLKEFPIFKRETVVGKVF